jgi:DNA sulfur modification protein DndD
MYIQAIQLRNWKAYASATLEFPKPGKKKNVVLVGAKNGYGKTSLLEAVLLCLYGKEAIGLLPRLSSDHLSDDKRPLSYDDFLERALHIQATQYGQASASVSLTLADEDDGDVIRIFREWHFTGGGKHRRGEEEVRIYQGSEGEPLHIPRNEDREEFYASYIAQNILPPSLAPFFFFDGEQVQRLAQRELSEQVKQGIEGILGLGIVKDLQKDLRTYATNHKSSARGMGDDKLKQLQLEVQAIEIRLANNEKELAHLSPQLEPIRRRRDELVRELKAATGGNAATTEELYRKLNEDQRERDRLRERLERLLCGDLALALVGRPLRTILARRLTAEEERSQWEVSKVQSSDKLVRLANALKSGTPPIEPPLTKEQVERLEERLQIAWESLWHPAPASCAAEYRHPYMGTQERHAVRQRLEAVDRLAVGELEELLDKLGNLEKSIRTMQSRISSLREVGDKAQQMTDEMKLLSDREKEIDLRVRDLQREITADKGLHAQKRPALLKELDQKQRSRPELVKVALAEKIIDLLDKTVEDAYPRNVEAIASWMSEAYREMAHKKQVREIKIDGALNVQLVGERGRDLRSFDSSAGESQIFALSLIAAIANVVRFSVPIIMDTPLARLDVEHRLKVLDYFTDRAGEQVILLSQPTEVHGQYLDKIRSRLSARFLIEHEELGDGLGLNRVRPDCYFEA